MSGIWEILSYMVQSAVAPYTAHQVMCAAKAAEGGIEECVCKECSDKGVPCSPYKCLDNTEKDAEQSAQEGGMQKSEKQKKGEENEPT
jgi:hypothetical protein